MLVKCNKNDERTSSNSQAWEQSFETHTHACGGPYKLLWVHTDTRKVLRCGPPPSPLEAPHGPNSETQNMQQNPMFLKGGTARIQIRNHFYTLRMPSIVLSVSAFWHSVPQTDRFLFLRPVNDCHTMGANTWAQTWDLDMGNSTQRVAHPTGSKDGSYRGQTRQKL